MRRAVNAVEIVHVARLARMEACDLVVLKVAKSAGPFGCQKSAAVAEARARGLPLCETFLSRSPRIEALHTNQGGRPLPVIEHARGAPVTFRAIGPVEQRRDFHLAVHRALAADLGRMRGQHRADQGVIKKRSQRSCGNPTRDRVLDRERESRLEREPSIRIDQLLHVDRDMAFTQRLQLSRSRTLHILAAEDVRWVLGLIGPGAIARLQPYFRRFDMDAPTVTRCASLCP